MQIKITGIKIEKNRVVITEAIEIDEDGRNIRKLTINEKFAIALRQTDFEINLKDI
tara:strand:+ start:319 stop:486 length:168 start_codon:yes stop_codon:yes gene_type:complete